MSGLRVLPSRVSVCVALLLTLCGAGSQALASTASPQLLPYTVTTVAGGATANPAAGVACGAFTSTDAYGDGCLATQVVIGTPRGVAGDSQGNLYLIDATNVLIRRIDARTGVITTVAGGGAALTAGAACGTLVSTDAYGDGCLGTQVKLAAPEGIAVDPQDNVWFTDFTLGSVREVSHASGIITTVVNTTGTTGYKAGNVADPGVVVPAAQGVLLKPYGIAFDNNGNLYIADNYNNTVEAVNLGSSTTTIAGVPIPAGAIYTILGSGCTYGTTGCGSNYGKTNGVATASLIDSPYQVAVDNAGNIYVADEFPYDVRVITPAGTVSVFANSAYTKSASIARGPAVTTSLASLYGVATDAFGNVYAAVYDTTTTSGYIDRVDIATGMIYPVGGQITATPAPTTPGAAANGATYCSSKTDAVGDGCPGTQATFYKPYQPFVDAAGNVYVADQGNNLIRRISVGTQFAPAAVGASQTQSFAIHFGAGDKATSYAVGAGFADFTLGAAVCTTNSDTTTDCVVPVTFKPVAPGVRTAPLVVKSSSGLVSTFALTGTGQGAVLALDPGVKTSLTASGVTGVAGIAQDTAGNTFAAVPTSASILRVSPGGASTNVGSGLLGATAVAVDGMGNVYAALASGSVMEVPANGAAQVTVGSGFAKPTGVAADAFGNVYVADAAANTVFEIAAKTGVLRVLATAASAGLSGPNGVTVDAAGNVFVANTVANNVVELPFAAGTPMVLGSGLSAPLAVAVDAAGSLYVADSKNGRVVFVPNEAGKLVTGDALTVLSGLSGPSGVAVAGSGTLYVADGAANALYMDTRSAGTVAFGNLATGTQATNGADLISAGNLPVTLLSPYYTATGNTTDFSLTPTMYTGGTTFAAGTGLPLTAGFRPTVAASRSAVFAFASTNATAPTLTLTGNGITPTISTATSIAVNPGSAIYGQTESVTITVSSGTGNAAATGTVTVKVDTTTYTPTLSSGAATIAVAGLSAGSHTVTASYPGDAISTPSVATPVSFTLAPAPLSIAVNSLNKAFGAVLPTLTGTLTGVVNNDQVGVTYSTTATATSPLGSYPITATLTGSAVSNYGVTVTPGTLTVVQAGTATTLTASSYAVSGSTNVTLTATVAAATSGTPTGSVMFLNGTTPIGSAVALVNGVASLQTTFAVTGQSTTNMLTAVYSGDVTYTKSASQAITVVSSTAGFAFSGVPTALTVKQGQTGLTSFTLTPTFGYAGTINFSCTGLPATIGCVFAPASVTSTGANTASLVTLSFSTVQPGLVAGLAPARGTRSLAPLAYAGLPGMLLLVGMVSGRHKLGKLGTRGLWLSVALALLGLGVTGCSTPRTTAGTPTGTYTMTVIGTGTPAVTGGANITTQFQVMLTVQ